MTGATETCSEKSSRHDVGSRAEQVALQLEDGDKLRLDLHLRLMETLNLQPVFGTLHKPVIASA